MNRKWAAVVAGGAAVGVAIGYGAPVLAASESRDAPTPGPFNMYSHGVTDGWHFFSGGGVFGSDQEYTYTQPSNGGVNFDEGDWKFNRTGPVTSVQIWDSASGIMVDYATYSDFDHTNSCFNQGAYANAMVTVIGSSYMNGQLQMTDSACIVHGLPVGADVAVVNY
jgi:hypothetical protein